MSVVNYKSDVKMSYVNIGEANKNQQSGLWECDIHYSNGPLLISTPRLKIIDQNLVFNIRNKKKFLEFLQNLENKIIDKLYENQQAIFKGKSFSYQRLKDSLQPSIDIEDNGNTYLKVLLDENIKCFDLFGENIIFENLSKDVSAVLHIEKIVFDKDLYRIIYKITHLKSTKPEKQKDINFEQQKQQIEKYQDCESSSNFFD